MASEEFKRAMAKIQKIEEVIQSMPAWQTGTPPEPEDYIVTEYDGFDYEATARFWNGICWVTENQVVAWMPLPEPYRGAGNLNPAPPERPDGL